jgi:hypothetical protein
VDTTPPLLVYRVPLHKLMPTTIIIDRPLHHSYIPAGDYVQHVALGTRADCICLVPVGRNAERHINSHYWVSESEAAQYSVPFIPMDHNPPEHGKLYMSLNLPEEYWPAISAALESAFIGGCATTVEEAFYKMALLWFGNDEPPRAA